MDRGHSAADVAQRQGISQYSLYLWIRKVGIPESALRRATEERDILKWAAAYFAKESR